MSTDADYLAAEAQLLSSFQRVTHEIICDVVAQYIELARAQAETEAKIRQQDLEHKFLCRQMEP